jgi:hypothetical protein
MSALILPRGTALQFYAKDPLADPADTDLGWRNITEHNRSEISINSGRIQQTKRMANGSLRKFYIADKKTFSMSWSLVPSYRSLTVDGYWGAEDLRRFYESDEGKGTFDVLFNAAKDGTKQDTALLGAEEYTVSISDCSFTLVKRGIQAHWNISLTLEEV